jgi:3-keto-disaccharide hydrolase
MAVGCAQGEDLGPIEGLGSGGASGTPTNDLAGSESAGSIASAGSAGASSSGVAGSNLTSGSAGSAGATGTAGSATAGSGGSRASDAGTLGDSAREGAITVSDAASGTVLLTEDFETDASHWAANTAGDWSIVNDTTKVYKQGNTAPAFRVAVAGNAAWTDVAIETRVKILGFAGQANPEVVGIYARFKDANNHYYAALRSDGKLGIRTKISGSNNTPGNNADVGFVVGKWYTIKFVVVGSTLTAYVDGVMKNTITDAAIASGAVAIGGINSTAEFDDVKVTAP